MDTGRSCQQ